MDTALSSGMRDMRSGLGGTIRLLDGVYPKRILERGYAYCMSEDGKRIIGKARDISKGDRMIVNFHDGGALCRVEGKRAGKRAKKS
jgi:exonuclease VII large subunit